MAPPVPLYSCAGLKYMQEKYDIMPHTDPAKGYYSCLYQAFKKEWKEKGNFDLLTQLYLQHHELK